VELRGARAASTGIEARAKKARQADGRPSIFGVQKVLGVASEAAFYPAGELVHFISTNAGQYQAEGGSVLFSRRRRVGGRTNTRKVSYYLNVALAMETLVAGW
jgi:hypothetical protein